MIDQIVGNITAATTVVVPPADLVNLTTSFLRGRVVPPLPQVYVRLDGSSSASAASRYRKCRIVDVNTDLDLAVLKLLDEKDYKKGNNNNNKKKDDLPYVSFGSSSELLVGQSVVGR
jgi:hypothetical protein